MPYFAPFSAKCPSQFRKTEIHDLHIKSFNFEIRFVIPKLWFNFANRQKKQKNAHFSPAAEKPQFPDC